MKKIISCMLSVLLMLSTSIGVGISASEEIQVEIDGKVIEFDVPPEIVDGRTMVPVRKIFEEIGALVKWNGETQTISARKSSKTVELTINSAEMTIDKGKTDAEGNVLKETVELDVPAQISEGRTLVPVRAITESFGLDVSWNEETKTVVIKSDEDKNDAWKENNISINLTELSTEGEGVLTEGNVIKITKGGDYTLVGTLLDGNIVVSSKEKVKIRLSGAKITSENNPCIFIEEADKAYITITDGTDNHVVAKNSEDGAIYSKENLEIKGSGSLVIESFTGHGIKASDNLTIENGNIKINSSSDGIHINDTFKMTGGKVDITSVGDGIDSESIVNISGGSIVIETNGTPIEASDNTVESGKDTSHRGMWEEKQNVEFEKSTKGINSEWMLKVSGGEININSASHAIHCKDEIDISGGSFKLKSKYDKGISAHGNLTISGSETIIDVVKSTEGIESKNILTVNGGTIKVISSDDAVNATGGSGGILMPPAFERDVEIEHTQGERPGRPQMDFTGERIGRIPDAFEPTSETGEFKPPFMMGDSELQETGQWEGNRPNYGIMPPMEAGRMPGGNMGGFGRDMKLCLIINGGMFELYSEDDCLDSNGNMTLKECTIKASNPKGSFSGAFGIIDPDGKVSIGDDVNLIFAANSGSERSLVLSAPTLVIHCEKMMEEKIEIKDADGVVIYDLLPLGNYRSLLISSSNLKMGENYFVTAGDEQFEVTLAEQTTVVGTAQQGGFGRFGRIK